MSLDLFSWPGCGRQSLVNCYSIVAGTASPWRPSVVASRQVLAHASAAMNRRSPDRAKMWSALLLLADTCRYR